MNNAIVLFFAADPASAPPSGALRLQLDEDVRRIREKVRAAEYRDALVFDLRLAARVDDLIQGLNETSPQVVHFSGHGSSEGLVLVGRDGSPHPVSAAALEELFRVFRGDIQVVVLNACLSLPQAQAIAAVVGCAIGTCKEISDEAAITFGASFYRALAFGHSVQTAFDQARVALTLEHPGEEETPRIISGPGVNPAQVFVVRSKDRETTVGAGHPSATGQERTQGIPTPAPTAGSSPGERLFASSKQRWTNHVPVLVSHVERRSWFRAGGVVLVVLALVGTYVLRGPMRVITQGSPRPDTSSGFADPPDDTSLPLSKIEDTVPTGRPDGDSLPAPETKLTLEGSRPDSLLASPPVSNPRPVTSSTPDPPSLPVAEPRSRPVPTPGFVVERVRPHIGPDQYKSYELAVADSRPCRLRGRVETIEGGSRDIDVLVLERSAFESFRHNRRYTPIFSARRTTMISLDVPLPGPGQYHLVISNRFSAFTSKWVNVEDVRWECTEGGSKQGDAPA